MRAASWNVERLDAASMTAMEASRTAVLVCQGRAAADGRIAVGRFADPVAVTMLRDQERVPVDRVRAGTQPAGWTERVDYEAVRACAELMVPRTIAIDEAVRARPAPQVVILGAGLDARAWRMKELPASTCSRSTTPHRSTKSKTGSVMRSRSPGRCGTCRLISPATGSTPR
jgi:O-methyltransferase involved in polyketide biosynthesis